MAAVSMNNKKTLPTGFQAQLRGASLWDLVQIECLARKHRVVRVTTVGNVGYLYFDDGDIVHAATLELEGEAAAFEMLHWSQGTFETCERNWPEHPSITISWQALLLRAAQIKDEYGRAKVLSLPSKDRVDHQGASITVESQMTMKAPPGDTGNGSNAHWNVEDFEVAVRLGPSGDVLASRGPTEEFADIVAYTARLVDILGELLGLEGFRGLECTFKHGRCLLLREADGSILGVKPVSPQVDLSLLRERMGI
jgi:hypothetical protein